MPDRAAIDGEDLVRVYPIGWSIDGELLPKDGERVLQVGPNWINDLKSFP